MPTKFWVVLWISYFGGSLIAFGAGYTLAASKAAQGCPAVTAPKDLKSF